MKKSINIDNSSEDPFYRYKMPYIVVKIEGRGNGIKTVLVNIDEIARCLQREIRHLVKYLSYEMGTLSSIDEKNSKYIINGAHEKERVQQYLFRFIDDFVLCKECRNPETTLYVGAAGKTVRSKCSACGHNETLKSTNKIMKTLLKELPAKDEQTEKDNEPFSGFENEKYTFG